MADTVVDMVSKADFVAAQKEIGDLRQRLEATKETQVNERITALDKTIAARDEEIKNLKIEVENVKAAKKEADKAIEAAVANEDKLKTALTEANKKIEEHTKSVVKANRISTLVDKGVDKAEAEKIVETFASATDEVFAAVVETHAKLVEAKKVAPASAADDEAAKKEKKKKEEKEAAKAAEEALKNAKPEEKEAPLSTDASAEGEVDAVIAGLSDFLSQEIDNKKKK